MFNTRRKRNVPFCKWNRTFHGASSWEAAGQELTASFLQNINATIQDWSDWWISLKGVQEFRKKLTLFTEVNWIHYEKSQVDGLSPVSFRVLVRLKRLNHHIFFFSQHLSYLLDGLKTRLLDWSNLQPQGNVWLHLFSVCFCPPSLRSGGETDARHTTKWDGVMDGDLKRVRVAACPLRCHPRCHSFAMTAAAAHSWIISGRRSLLCRLLMDFSSLHLLLCGPGLDCAASGNEDVPM